MDSKNPVKICWDIVFQQSPLWTKIIAGLLLISIYQMAIAFWDGTQGRRCQVDAWYNPPNSTTAVIGCFVRGLIDSAPRNYPEETEN